METSQDYCRKSYKSLGSDHYFMVDTLVSWVNVQIFCNVFALSTTHSRPVFSEKQKFINEFKSRVFEKIIKID